MMRKINDWNQKERIVLFISDPNDSYEKRDVPRLEYKNGRLYFIMGEMAQEIDTFEGDFAAFKSGDILSISSSGNVTLLHSGASREVDIFVTNRCNSNCIMCPLSDYERRRNLGDQIQWLKQYIEVLPEDIDYINITGGEPTLAKRDFIDILNLLYNKFQYAGFQILTNGRSAADLQFLKEVLQYCPNGIRFAIPIHAANAKVHDMITRAKGSFVQTDRGIRNLLMQKQKIEIRIVVSKLNISYMEETANYIVRNYKHVFCVNFVAMEMMGNAAQNREEIWIDYAEAFQNCKSAIDILVKNGIDVQLYNFPLCAVDSGYRKIVAKSITDHKIRYMNECNNCAVRQICGGFFFSTKQIMKPKVQPIRIKI